MLRRSLAIVCLCLSTFASITALAQELAQPSPSPSPQSSPSPSPDTRPPFEAALDRLEWRSIGPANMGGRTADVEGVPGDPNTVFVASASGGLWKTVNGGISWKPIFERQGTISLGDIALAPGNPDVVWAGTGESNTRNSVSFGDGVYRSTDGGKTWQHMTAAAPGPRPSTSTRNMEFPISISIPQIPTFSTPGCGVLNEKHGHIAAAAKKAVSINQ